MKGEKPSALRARQEYFIESARFLSGMLATLGREEGRKEEGDGR